MSLPNNALHLTARVWGFGMWWHRAAETPVR